MIFGEDIRVKQIKIEFNVTTEIKRFVYVYLDNTKRSLAVLENIPGVDVFYPEWDQVYSLAVMRKKIAEARELISDLESAVCDAEAEMELAAKVAIGFFIAGFIGVILSVILNKVDIGHTFFSGLITGLANGIGPGAMIVGLLYAYSNIKSLREAKARLLKR